MEKRIFWIGICLTVAGGGLAWILADGRSGLSLLAGGALAGVNLLWLRRTIGQIMFHDPKRSRQRILALFFLRLLLIPLCLYAMIRFLFLGVIPVVAGFALFHFSVMVEGMLEALGSTPR
jgi:hypothetical protein